MAWLDADGRRDGIEAAVDGLTGTLPAETDTRAWHEPQRQGAHAVLRWSEDGRAGGLVIETRRGAVVLAIAVP